MNYNFGVNELEKFAKIYTQLLPHQERVVERLQGQPGLVVAHGLGTGKTLASIAAGEKNPGGTEVLLPASLMSNYQKEVKKHTRGSFKPRIQSMQKATGTGKLDPSDLLIVDEAHRARELGSKLRGLIAGAPAKKRMLLTASPLYNRPSDIASLVDLAAGQRVLPLGKDFEQKYVEQPSKNWTAFLPWSIKEPRLRNKEELGKILRQWVDYEAPSGDFPEKSEEKIQVPMSPEQTKLHDYAWGKLPFISRLRLKAGLPPDKKDLPHLNAFESQTRQLSGSMGKFDPTPGDTAAAPKTQRAVEEVLKNLRGDPESRALVYSNYLSNLKDYGGLLEKEKMPYRLFTGEESKSDKDKAIADYNKGIARALLVSSAGGEGLDLKGTRLVQVLEPHWNDEKLEQVIGRAARRGSHAALPPEKRNVNIQRYEAYPQPGFVRKLFGSKPKGIEQVLSTMSENKKKLNDQVLDLLRNSEKEGP
jgi:SNF2 family DNA or RNA helicase